MGLGVDKYVLWVGMALGLAAFRHALAAGWVTTALWDGVAFPLYVISALAVVAVGERKLSRSAGQEPTGPSKRT